MTIRSYFKNILQLVPAEYSCSYICTEMKANQQRYYYYGSVPAGMVA